MTPKPKLSFSGRRSLHECARKFMLQSVHRKPWFRPAVELGTAFHKLMDLTLTAPPDKILSEFATWRTTIEKAVRERLNAEDMDKLRQAHDKAVPLWESYWHVMNSGAVQPRTLEVLATEYRFLIELDECYIPGIIDQIAVVSNPWFGSKENNAVFPEKKDMVVVLDYKTTSTDLPTYLTSLMKSGQGPLYLHWAQSEAFKREFPAISEQYGQPVAVMFDIVGTPAIRLKKSENWEEFLARYSEVFISDISNFFLRKLWVPSYNVISDTLKGFRWDARYFSQCLAEGYWPKNDKSCLQNRQLCEYGSECDCVSEGSTDRPSNRQRLVQIGEDDGANDSDDE